MCGFAGVVTWDEKYRITQDTLGKMSRAIAHRGPDGEGYHLTRQNEPITPDTPQVGLAFRRLAILDPDPRSDQPFHIGPLTLVFNGEIYNFRELKSELSNLRPDYQWRTTGDTEVLLLAYDVWREECVEKLNGMFAFAVWDEQKKELFLARDRMGQKPLYMIVPGGSDDPVFAFASEIAAVRDYTCLWPEGVLQSWLTRYLSVGASAILSPYIAGELSPGSFQLYQFTTARLTALAVIDVDEREKADDYELINRRYFNPNVGRNGAIEPVAIRVAVERVVSRQLVSDVPFGIFLSGGIDSSVIAACARRDGPVHTFSIGFDDPRYDESQYAREVAAYLGTEHHEFCVKPKIAEDLRALARAFDEPFADSSAIPMHHLCREAREHVKVALSGDGGDELFGGYDRYLAMSLPAGSRLLAPLRPIGRLFAGGHPKSRLTRAGRFLKTCGISDHERYDSYLRVFDDATIGALLGLHGPFFGGVAEVYRNLRREHGPVEAALATDRLTYLPYDILTKVDRCSMMHGLEVRSPFMDHELVQFAAGLTTDQLLKGGPKRMLREAFAKDLPDFVFKRKKMGFAVPIGEWFRGELRGMLRDNLFASNSFGSSHFNMKVVERLVDEHETQRVDHSQRLYALLMLELWWQQQKQ